MSKKFNKSTMKAGAVYRLTGVSGSAKAEKYVGKLFIGASTGWGDAIGITQAVCLEDGYAFDGLLSYVVFEEASAKIVDLD